MQITKKSLQETSVDERDGDGVQCFEGEGTYAYSQKVHILLFVQQDCYCNKLLNLLSSL